MQAKKIFSATLIAVWVLAAAAAAYAQGNIKLQSVAEVETEVVAASGKKEIQRLPAAKVVPGTEVIFTTHYENISSKPAENAVITNPVPEHMLYKADSAEGAGTRITFSVDGGKTFDIPAKLLVYDAAGRSYPARVSDYTHIRWTFSTPLKPGVKGSVSFRAVLQ